MRLFLNGLSVLAPVITIFCTFFGFFIYLILIFHGLGILWLGCLVLLMNIRGIRFLKCPSVLNNKWFYYFNLAEVFVGLSYFGYLFFIFTSNK
jgi:hypothetical protein